ncbi:TMEM175 family protein [Streptomyces sp. NPDC088725]|uniref:TMEM175 family protein n=1 Tax=Streptomyces sp. NPDC088725 TaxID=3365873 RepID=UPI0038168488
MDTSSGLTDEVVTERATIRMFGLADAVFAIAMTLLALDLRVPDLGGHTTDQELRHALGDQSSHYLAFLLSFYVVGSYWRRHRTETRSVVVSHAALVRWTLFLLLTVCAMPFVTGLLASYGSETGFALVTYAGVNACAVASLLMIRYVAGRHRSSPDVGTETQKHELWLDLVAFLLSVPAAYVFPGNGSLTMAGLLVVSGAIGSFLTWRARKASHAGPR